MNSTLNRLVYRDKDLVSQLESSLNERILVLDGGMAHNDPGPMI